MNEAKMVNKINKLIMNGKREKAEKLKKKLPKVGRTEMVFEAKKLRLGIRG